MCGIAALFDPQRRRDSTATAEVLAAMTAPLAPRGPDAAGQWIDHTRGIGLGHRRLAVLDLSDAGTQPMVSADGRWVLTYNGEIYNHREVLARLPRVRWRGHSDTEVLVEAIAAWGVSGALDAVDGMFAFAVWDRQGERLTLARDRMGEKPLYYGRVGRDVVVGSTLDAIAAHPDFNLDIDLDALSLFFRHKYVPAPWSIQRGVSKLPPGSMVEIAADGSIGEPRAYWSYLDIAREATPFGGSLADATDELSARLQKALTDRLVADVAVGAFLSGGVDSAAVVAAAQAVATQPLRTFTIGLTEAGYDESRHAAAVARHLGTDHTEYVVGHSDARAVVPELATMFDEPFGDSSQIPTHLVSAMARRSVTVALSGDGGDELFGGYNRYRWAPRVWGSVRLLPVAARRGVARAARRLPAGFYEQPLRLVPASRRPRQLSIKVAKILDVADAASPEDLYLRIVSHWRDPASLVIGGSEPPTLHRGEVPAFGNLSFPGQMMAVDAVTYLPDDILVKVDRAAMAVSLETRVPLLARSVVEFAATLPVGMKLGPGGGKPVLRELIRRHVPDQLTQRPKAGFGVPIGAWLRGPLRPWAAGRLDVAADTGALQMGPIRAAWEDHQSGVADHSFRLWDVVMFAAWFEARTGAVQARARRRAAMYERSGNATPVR